MEHAACFASALGEATRLARLLASRSGEGLLAAERVEPPTQLQLSNKLPSFRNPLPKEREAGSKLPPNQLLHNLARAAKDARHARAAPGFGDGIFVHIAGTAMQL
jgi:hypothetical protein